MFGSWVEWRVHNKPNTKIRNDIITGCRAYANNNRTAVFYNRKIENYVNELKTHLNEDLQHYMTAVRINMLNLNLIIICYYRSNAKDTKYKLQCDDLMKEMNRMRNKYSKNTYYLINGDFNVKNTKWFSTQTTKAGEYYYDTFNVQQPMSCTNTCTHTYIANDTHNNIQYPETLDLTWIDKYIRSKLKNWEVHNAPTDWQPDHFCITYDIFNPIKMKPKTRIPRLDYRNADWDKFNETLNINMLYVTNLLDTLKYNDIEQVDTTMESYTWAYSDAALKSMNITYDPLEYTLEKDAKYNNWRKLRDEAWKNLKNFQKYCKIKCKKIYDNKKQQLRKMKNKYTNRVRKRKKQIIQSFNKCKIVEKMNNAIEFDSNLTIQVFWQCINFLRSKGILKQK